MNLVIIYCYYLLLFIFPFVLLSLISLPFFRFPSLVPLSCSFWPENYVIRSQAIIFVCKTKLPLSFSLHTLEMFYYLTLT